MLILWILWDRRNRKNREENYQGEYILGDELLG
jgi:hypothetical protein